MPDSIIKLKNVNKIYNLDGLSVKALDNINLSIEKGDFIAIMGPSGSGKSTLMHLLGLLDKPTTGEVFLQNQNINNLSENVLAKIRNQKIGFVFQNYNLLPKTSALENVELTLLYSKISSRLRRQKALDILNKVGLNERINHFPSQLSGGQQQRVAIARALINNPLLLIADEPTGNLDSKSGEEIIQLLLDLNNNGSTIIMVTHDPEIASHAKKIIKIRDGKII